MPAEKQSQLTAFLPLLLLGGAVVLWGTSFASMKIALTGFDPMAVVWFRMTVGSAIILPLWSRIPKPDRQPGDGKWLVVLVVLQPCLYFLFEGFALDYTTSAQAGMISAIVPLLVALGARVFLAEKLTRLTLVGLVLSVIGVVALSLGGESSSQASNPILGNSLEILAMTAGAAYMLVIRHLSPRYNPWLLTGIQTVTGAVFFLPAALLSHPETWMSAPPEAWLGAAYLGGFVTLGAFGLYNMAMSRVAAARAVIAINLVPLVAVATGWIVLGEALTPVQFAAGAVIAMAVYLGEKGSRTPAGEFPPVPEVA
ncbi:MAG: DMT family transporter [Actinomycetota bacterium]|nr:DMT family transporter [Actinomycetota bacterium]